MKSENQYSPVSISTCPICEATLNARAKLDRATFLAKFKDTIEQFAKYSPNEITRTSFEITDGFMEDAETVARYIHAILTPEMSDDGRVMDEKVSFDELRQVIWPVVVKSVFPPIDIDGEVLLFTAYLMYASDWALEEEFDDIASYVDWEEAINSPEDDISDARVWYLHVPKGFRLVEHLVLNYKLQYRFNSSEGFEIADDDDKPLPF